MGVFVVEDTGCTSSALAALQTELKEAGNAFCFLGVYTAVDLPNTFDVSSIDTALKKLDITEKSASADWDGGSVTLIVCAALSAAAAVYLLARHLFMLPHFLQDL